MNAFLLIAVLITASPAGAQLAYDAAELARVSDGARSLRERLAPAKVNSKPIQKLFDRFVDASLAVESMTEMQDVFKRTGSFDALGKLHNIQFNIMVLPGSDEGYGTPRARHAICRRFFSHIRAKSEDVRLRPDGTGRVDVWDWVVSLDGRLLSATHAVVPLASVAPGVTKAVKEKVRAYRMSPSDPAVLRRWDRVVKDILTLGRTVAI